MMFKFRKMKYPEFRFMEIPDGDNGTYELIAGVPVRRPGHVSQHQLASAHIFYPLSVFIKKNDLGVFYTAPLDVVFNQENALMPDLFFISKQREYIIDPEGVVEGVPDMVIEIIMPCTARYDRGDKKDLYERFQVKEYWIADPNNKSIEVYNLKKGRYKLVSYAAIEGAIESVVLPGLDLKLEDIFS